MLSGDFERGEMETTKGGGGGEGGLGLGLDK